VRCRSVSISDTFAFMSDGTTSTQGGVPSGVTTTHVGGGTTGTSTATGTDTQQVVTRPDYIPENFWDDQAKAIKPEFATHYAEVATFHKAETERQAALKARKPEDIKFEVKLPDTVKVPDGIELKIDDKDPRIPVIREMALKNGWDQDTVNGLVALDAQQKIEAHNAEVARMAEEDKKLGAEAPARKQATATWLKGLKDNGTITAGEYEAARIYTSDADGVTFLEKIIAKSNGSIGTGGNPPSPTTPPVTLEQKWFGTPPTNRKVS
jgi:hypothetical protein